MSKKFWLIFGLVLIGATALAYATLVFGFWNTSEQANIQAYKTATSKFTDMDGVRVHYSDEGSGLPILLIHGSSESLRTWDGVAVKLLDKYRVVRFDVPDNGLSSADPKHRYSVEDDEVRISALMDKLGLHRFAIGGSSWGGTIAYNYAVAHPERVTALVIMSIPGVRPTNAYFSANKGLSPFDLWLNQFYVPPAQTEASIRSVSANTAYLTPAQIKQYQDLINQKGRPGAWISKLSQIRPAEADARAHVDLAKVSAPTMIAWGRNNPAFGPGCADDLEKILVHAPLVRKFIYDNVGHKVEREAPGPLGADMRAFLDSVTYSPQPGAAARWRVWPTQ